MENKKESDTKIAIFCYHSIRTKQARVNEDKRYTAIFGYRF